MIPAGQVVEDVLVHSNHKADAEMIERVWRILQKNYFHLCKKWSWKALRRRTELDFTADSDDTGIYLPANLFGIDMVRDQTDDKEFMPRDYSGALEPDDWGYRYYTYAPSQTDAFAKNDLVLAPSEDTGTNTFASSDLGSEDYTGDYIRFGSELGYYLLTDATEFTPYYFGPELNQERYIIRPKETEKMVIVDSAENNLTDRTVEVYYWEAPQPLYRDYDMIVLPLSKPLELMTIREVPECKARRPVSQQEIDSAVKEALALNPDFPRATKPRDIHNAAYDFSKVPYQRRGQR